MGLDTLNYILRVAHGLSSPKSGGRTGAQVGGVMSTKDEGIFVPRRLMFIMIFVSLCVNVFFLLMGILIGKDDIKWKEQSEGDLPVAHVSDDPDPRRALEDDLSVFEEPTTTERRPPIDQRYLEQTPKTAETRSQPMERTEIPPVTRPKVEESRPKPPQTRPKPKPTAQYTGTTTTGGFWIQVMAISDRAKAQAFLNKVKNKGFSAVMVNEGAFHKIRVGPYKDRAKADQARARVNKSLGVKGWVVSK